MSTPSNPYAGMTLEELMKNSPPWLRKKRPPEPEKAVKLVVSNPEVPLDRQRERISEAQARLIADEERRLQELEEANRRDRWIAERQRALDWHMEMKLANEEAERRFSGDPYNIGLWSRPSCHRGPGED